MRVSDSMMHREALNRLHAQQAAVQIASNQISTGNRFSRISDNVVANTELLSLEAERAGLEQAARNGADGQLFVDQTQAALTNFMDVLRSIRSTTLASTNPLDDDTRTITREELVSLRDELVSIANTRRLGQGLFAGHRSFDAVEKIGGVWSYTGDTGTVRRRIGPDETVNVSVFGGFAFGFAQGNNLFTLVDDIETDIIANDTTALVARLDDIDEAMERIEVVTAFAATAAQRVSAAGSRVSERLGTIEARIAELGSTDVATAAVELQRSQAALEATLAVIGRSFNTSLLDFLA